MSFWIISQLLCGRCSFDEVVIVDIKGCYLLPGNGCAGIGGVKMCMWLWFVNSRNFEFDCGLCLFKCSKSWICCKNFQDDCQDLAALESSEWRCLVIAFSGTQSTRLQDLRLTDNVSLFIHRSQFILIIILITSGLNCTNTCCEYMLWPTKLSIGNPIPPS